jgi:hypothetical protein
MGTPSLIIRRRQHGRVRDEVQVVLRFNLYGSNSPPLAALSMKQHFDDTPLLRSRSRARGERACPGEASFNSFQANIVIEENVLESNALEISGK